jgi:hypothetical protein
MLAELEPDIGARGLRHWASSAVAVVTAGRSHLARLVSTGELLRASPVELVDVLLTNASRYDDTLGIAPEEFAPGTPPVEAESAEMSTRAPLG